MKTIQRKGWVIYFPQFDKYYPYVPSGRNSFTEKLVSAEDAQIFTRKDALKRVMRLYTNFWNRETVGFTDISKPFPVPGEDHACVPNCVASIERMMMTTLDGSRSWWMYNPTKSVVADPCNTPLEVQVIECEIHIPVTGMVTPPPPPPPVVSNGTILIKEGENPTKK